MKFEYPSNTANISWPIGDRINGFQGEPKNWPRRLFSG